MPHVTIRIAAGRSEGQKQAIAEAFVDALVRTAGCDVSEVSVDVQDVAQDRWLDDVYRPEILPRLGCLQKKPGYDPL